MEESGRLFRNAMFGFNKEDVMAYAEQCAAQLAEQQKRAEEELSALQGEFERQVQTASIAEATHVAALKEAETALADCRQELAGVREEGKQALEACEKALRAEMEEALAAQRQTYEKELAARDHEIGELRAKNAEQLLACERMAEEKAALERTAEEYLQIKDKLTEIELSAHLRAVEVEREAEENARRIRETADQYIKKAENSLMPLLHEADKQNQRAEEALCALRQKMAALSEGAAAVAGAIRDMVSEKEDGTKEAIREKMGDVKEFISRFRADRAEPCEEEGLSGLLPSEQTEEPEKEEVEL